MRLWRRGAASLSAPPPPPTSGPGSPFGLPHAAVTTSVHLKGTPFQYHLFAPADPLPRLAPLTVSLHGWGELFPGPNMAWIRHVVRRGHLVVHPRYQTTLFTSFQDFTKNALGALRAALELVSKPDEERPLYDPDRLDVIGHSMGGVIALNLAALAQGEGLPPFRSVMCVHPGNAGRESVVADLSLIPPETFLLCLCGSDDKMVNDRWAGRFIDEAFRVPWSRKNHITVRSDRHGAPPLVAHHFSPLGKNNEGMNALSWYGYWKWQDGLSDAAFYGKNERYALGNTAEQRFMGRWSDGTPVVEPLIRTPDR